MLPFIRFPSRIKENGQERVEIEEDGVLKRVLVNGKASHCCHQDISTSIFLIVPHTHCCVVVVPRRGG